MLIQSICQQKCFEDSWFNQTHFRVQRLALQRGVLCLLPVLSQGRAPSDFLGYSLLTLSIIADYPWITIDKITKLREKIFFTFVQLFS